MWFYALHDELLMIYLIDSLKVVHEQLSSRLYSIQVPIYILITYLTFFIYFLLLKFLFYFSILKFLCVNPKKIQKIKIGPTK